MVLPPSRDWENPGKESNIMHKKVPHLNTADSKFTRLRHLLFMLEEEDTVALAKHLKCSCPVIGICFRVSKVF